MSPEEIAQQMIESVGNPYIEGEIHGGHYSIYVRHPGYHVIIGERYSFLDIPNIEFSESIRGRSIFKRILAVIEQKEHVFIENVFNERLCMFLARRGYTIQGSEFPYSYYRLKGCRFCGIHPEDSGRPPVGHDQTCDNCWEMTQRIGIPVLDAKRIAGSQSKEYMKLLVEELNKQIQ